MNIGDLVLIKPGRSKGDYYPFNRDMATRGVIFSQIDNDWFRVYCTWGENIRMAEYPRWMLEVISEGQ